MRDDIVRTVETLDREGIPYMLVGGYAAEVLGLARSTLDVDIQVALDRPLSKGAPSVFGLLVEERARDEVFGQDTIIAHRAGSAIPIELFMTDHWLTKQALARRRRLRSPLLGTDVYVPTAEDFILMKGAFMVHASRTRAKAAQDAVDIETIAHLHEGTLDRRYLSENASKLGLTGALVPLLGPL